MASNELEELEQELESLTLGQPAGDLLNSCPE